ncbi:MAG: class I SAM-dependent DNA methyltransferase [Thermoleophilaceae bacterium]
MATAEKPFDITFPRGREEDRDQDEEFCEVAVDGEIRKIRFHDYHEIFKLPGLYEQLFYEELKCDSPRTVADLIGEQLDGEQRAALRVLDVGAGNGMVGEELDELGAGTIVGVDIIEEAAEAAERDRPGLYDDYFVVDLTDIPADARTELEAKRFNCLTTVAALGFGDIPPEAFSAAYNLVDDDGLIAFNIKEKFVEDGDRSGFEQMIQTALDDGTMELQAQRRYRHRLAVSGDPLYYIAIVARKRSDL